MNLQNFIFVPGHAINPAAISHIKFNRDGSAHVTIGRDVLVFEGSAAEPFFAAAPKGPAVPVGTAPDPVAVPTPATVAAERTAAVNQARTPVAEARTAPTVPVVAANASPKTPVRVASVE